MNNNTEQTYRKIERGVQPEAQGLYHPEQERENCGVGFICNMNGEKSNKIIHQALDILFKLTHRGACSCDGKTGDGAGLVIQLPHEFLTKVAKAEGIELPEIGHYGTGLVFLPKIEEQIDFIKDQFAKEVADEGHTLLGWRTVPVDTSVLGSIAAQSEPTILQVFIAAQQHVQTSVHLNAHCTSFESQSNKVLLKATTRKLRKNSTFPP